MILPALLVVALSVPSHAAPLALPSFESAALDLQTQLAIARAAAVQTRDENLAPRLNGLTADIGDQQKESSRLHKAMLDLRARLVRAGGRPVDTELADDVRALLHDLRSLSRGIQRGLSDAQSIDASISGQAPDLAVPAAGFVSAAARLAGETRWLDIDVRSFGNDLRAGGFSRELLDLEIAVRDITLRSSALKNKADRIASKTR